MSRGVIGVSSAEQGRYSAFYASLTGLRREANTLSVFASSAVISENRNIITQQTLKLGADWVLFLDDDHLLKADTLERLLDAEKDVISAHYTKRTPPFGPVLLTQIDAGYIWNGLPPHAEGIVEVDAVGAGCLLVRRRVLEALTEPYWTLGQLNPTTWGDDLHFCQRVRAAGFNIYCDLDNTIKHFMIGAVEPRRDVAKGWVAEMTQPASHTVLAEWFIPRPGDL